MLEAVLSISLQDCWITSIAPRHQIEFRVIDRKPIGRDRMKDLFEAQIPRESVPGLVEAIRKHPSVRSLEVVSTERGRLVGIASSANCGACSALAQSDCFIAGAVCRRSSVFEWNLIVQDRQALGRLVSLLQRGRHDVKLLRLTPVQEVVPLTPRQEEILAAALQFGYFDYPKRIRLEALAKRLGVSKSTASEALRKAQTKVVGAYFRKSTT